MKEVLDFFVDFFVAKCFKFKNLRNQYIFIWIPKNAGTSIYFSLRKKGMIKYKRLLAIKYFFNPRASVTFGHISLDSLLAANLVKEKDICGANFFAVLRDPYDRFNSIYNYYLDKGVFDRYNTPPTKTDILGILESGHYPKVGLYHHISLSMFNTQVSWIPKNRKLTYFLQDNLEQDANFFFKSLNEKLKLVVGNLNSSVDSGRDDLSDLERLRIRSFYCEDFDLINSLKQEDLQK